MALFIFPCPVIAVPPLAGETVRWDKCKMDVVGKAGKNTTAYARKHRTGYKLLVYR